MSSNPVDPNNMNFDPNNANFDPNSAQLAINQAKLAKGVGAHPLSLVDQYAIIMIQSLERSQEGVSKQQAVDTQTTQNAAKLLDGINNYWYGSNGVLQYWAQQVAYWGQQNNTGNQNAAQAKYQQASANANVSTGQMQSIMSQSETVASNDTTNLQNIAQVQQSMMALFSFIASKM